MKNEISKKEMQWRIYIEAKEAVLGGPQFIKKIIKNWLGNNNNALRLIKC